MSGVDPVKLHTELGTHKWTKPAPWGPGGWMLIGKSSRDGVVIVSVSLAPGEAEDGTDGTGVEWIHASVSKPDRMPSYGDLAALHRAAFPGWAYQMFSPPSEHVNIHEHALHLWGRLDGEPVAPNFGMYGTI